MLESPTLHVHVYIHVSCIYTYIYVYYFTGDTCVYLPTCIFLFFFPCWCVQEGDLENVKRLLEQHQGIVNLKSGWHYDDTPLIAAAKAGRSEVRLSSAIAVVAVYSQECNGHVE